MNIKVKICGITSINTAMESISSGADALGFVFFKESPRYIEPEKARAIIDQLPPFVSCVGLFVDENADGVNRIITTSGIDVLQFHGHESNEFCRQFRRPFLKSLRVSPEVSIDEFDSLYPDARALLLDAYHPSIYGGTGLSFDWSLIPNTLTKPIILAGGLNMDNVSEAAATPNIYAVDVSSGVELSPGVKCKHKIEKFIKEIKIVNTQLDV